MNEPSNNKEQHHFGFKKPLSYGRYSNFTITAIHRTAKSPKGSRITSIHIQVIQFSIGDSSTKSIFNNEARPPAMADIKRLPKTPPRMLHHSDDRDQRLAS
ncbi:hypothetical protein Nepgr_026665 [Nepenthes gracilis]|uniref:Uncharacterized protein n=1 Tax=Nepenthes gracilis TaxID=150966 RepID=A0AAD3Y0L2_NEPGR|nr:hypothetical protein Nepgr_026665 [Nepenthes gracilis]